VERDRAAAIRQALGAAQSGDVVLVAGKGHEAFQIVGAEHRPFSDRVLVAELTGAAA
jgi:UDP-N-acetylmuramoyl-L-alanyl-D-glutamate--2,6-diaminopimelate ligase